MFHAISFKDLREANVFIYFGRNIVYEELSLKQQDIHAYIQNYIKIFTLLLHTIIHIPNLHTANIKNIFC